LYQHVFTSVGDFTHLWQLRQYPQMLCRQVLRLTVPGSGGIIRPEIGIAAE
jgi:hypothetical protein